MRGPLNDQWADGFGPLARAVSRSYVSFRYGSFSIRPILLPVIFLPTKRAHKNAFQQPWQTRFESNQAVQRKSDFSGPLVDVYGNRNEYALSNLSSDGVDTVGVCGSNPHAPTNSIQQNRACETSAQGSKSREHFVSAICSISSTCTPTRDWAEV